MKLFTLGPVEMFPYTLEEAAKPIPYFRTPEFSKIVLESEQMLKEFANLEEDGRAVFLTCSGTGAMEATIINCLTEEDKVLIIDGGSFGHRFVQLAELHHIPAEIIRLDREEALTEEHLKKYEGCGLTALLVNIDETSTCQLYPIDMLSAFCRRNGMLFIVDAISAFLVDDIDMTRDGIDAMIVSSQKAFALAPGLSVVMLSGRMIRERVERIESGCMYLDFKDHLKNGERGQTPFTPAVSVVYQMHQRLTKIKEIGLDAEMKRAKDVAADFRKRAQEELPVRLPEYPISNACTPLIFDNGKAFETYEALKEEFGLFVTPNGGDLATRIVRVGHMGNHTIEDNIELVARLKEVLSR